MNRYTKDLNDFYAVRLKDYSMEGSSLSLTVEDQQGSPFTIAVSFYKNDILRVRLYSEVFQLCYDLVNSKFLIPDNDIKLSQEGNLLTVKYGSQSLLIGREPFSFAIQAADGHLIYEENFNDVNPVGEKGEDLIPPMGFSKDNEGNIVNVNICAALRWNEHIYGMGERFTEFDRRGQQVVLMNKDTLGCRDETSYKNIPFYLSTYGYGLFVNTSSISEFNFGYDSNNSISIHVPQSCLEYYLIAGDSMKTILSRYTELTGPAVLPPDWSFGLWYSTGFKGNSSENTLADARRIRQEGIPCDVMHFDCYWLRDDMWCDFVWDEKFYPNRIDMLKTLKEMGFKSCLWINPYVTIKTDMFREGAERGYLVKRPDGSVYTEDLWHGLLSYCAIVDFTNKDAVKWFQEKVRTVLLEGVDVMKTDFGEDIPLDSVFSNGKTGREMRNLYSRLYNQAVFEAMESVKGKGNGIVWARSGCAGMQKFPVCWSGDARSSFEGMAAALRGGLSLSMSGVPFWSHDMGGFYGEVKEEVFIRWCQFGLFSSHSRLHGTTTRQPWAYGKRALDIVRDFIKLRYRLMPYILKNAKKCVEQSVPFVRPLILEHPNDPAVAGIWDQYYFGDDIIAAPVFGGDNTARWVYLPEGEWQDMLTKKQYTGRQWINLSCPLNYMPIFCKAGVKIPMEEKDYLYVQ